MKKPPWYSRYEDYNYGELFYSLVRIYQPTSVVELGTKAGFVEKLKKWYEAECTNSERRRGGNAWVFRKKI